MLAWNCGGFAASKASALALCVEALPSSPPVVALLETHRFLAPAALRGYTVRAAAQNHRQWLSTATGSKTGQFFGGVALAVDETRAQVLAVETALCFVVGVVRVMGLGDFVVAAVYIPPHESRNSPGRYCDVLDSLQEAVGRLQLRH